MFNEKRTSFAATILVTGLIAAPGVAFADTGFYLGVAAGGATLEADIGDIGIPNIPTGIDEDDTATEIFGGFTFDLPLVNISAELGYVDFGAPEVDIAGQELTLDTTGLNAWGIVALDAGLIDIYGKLGVISWEIDAALAGADASEDGTDLAYGLGASFGLGPVEIRGEYEVYDLDETDLSMLSVGVLYRF